MPKSRSVPNIQQCMTIHNDTTNTLCWLTHLPQAHAETLEALNRLRRQHAAALSTEKETYTSLLRELHGSLSRDEVYQQSPASDDELDEDARMLSATQHRLASVLASPLPRTPLTRR